MPDPRSRSLITLASAADYLGLPVDAVRALVDASYLEPAQEGPDGPLFPMVDLKAFLARNADNGAGNLLLTDPEAAGPDALLDLLGARSGEMAHRAFDIFSAAVPDARTWSLSQRARFVEQAKGRFEAILAVTGHGSAVDRALEGDLEKVGAAAAADEAPLSQLLAVLRISRDVVLQTAVEVVERKGVEWALALSLLLTRVLPAMDRLTDALSRGYWSTRLQGERGGSG
jgi:hypothetical protein